MQDNIFLSNLFFKVMKQLKYKYGDLYNHNNVIMTGTHTHSGPGGYIQYTLLMISSGGLIKPTLNAIVNGIINVRQHPI